MSLYHLYGPQLNAKKVYCGIPTREAAQIILMGNGDNLSGVIREMTCVDCLKVMDEQPEIAPIEMGINIKAKVTQISSYTQKKDGATHYDCPREGPSPTFVSRFLFRIDLDKKPTDGGEK